MITGAFPFPGIAVKVHNSLNGVMTPALAFVQTIRLAYGRTGEGRANRRRAQVPLLKHLIATLLLDAGADLAFVKDWLGHANIENTTIYARLTTATLDAQERTMFASHRVV